MRTFWYSRLFRHFFHSYVLILLLPFLCGSIAYMVAYQIIAGNTKESIQSAVNQTIESVNQHMQEIEGFAWQLSLNSELNDFSKHGKQNERLDTYAMSRAWRSIVPYSVTNTILRDFYIYLHQSDVIFHPSSPFVRPRDFYGLRYYEQVSQQEWQEQMLRLDTTGRLMPGQTAIYTKDSSQQVLVYMRSLPLHTVSKPNATLVINIDESLISRPLKQITERYNGWVIVKTASNEVVMQVGAFDKGQGGPALDDFLLSGGMPNIMKFEQISTVNGWQYIAGVPRDVVFAQANHIRNVTAIAFGLTLLLGMVLSFVLSYRRSKPLQHLASLINDQPTSGESASAMQLPDYHSLHGNIASLLEHRRLLVKEFEWHKPVLQSNYLRQVLEGSYESEMHMRQALQQVGLEWQGDHGIIVLIGLMDRYQTDSAETSKSMDSLIIENALRQHNRVMPLFVHLHAGVIALIYTHEQIPSDKVQATQRQTLLDLSALLRRDYHLTTAIARSLPFTQMADVSHAYAQAREALDYALLNHTPLVDASELSGSGLSYNYPLDMEVRLINAGRIGDTEQVRALLQRVRSDNANLSPEMNRQLLHVLRGTLYRLLDQKVYGNLNDLAALKAEIDDHAFQTSQELQFAHIEQAFVSLSEMALARSDHEEEQDKAHMLAIIKTHYQDPLFSLCRFADELELSEKVASQLFKDKIGNNFHTYVEGLRMQEATELLFQSVKSIDEIALATGYNSAHTFRRAFKRVTGVTPSEYRKSN